ncbi:MAG: urease accessory protein UreF [Xanthobacteraceae bacterium]|nr:urease accessory protein UreF [Xanthobacteraceae bacterium]
MLMRTPDSEADHPGTSLTAEDKAALYRLMTWLSPSFPVGAFSYSSGLEWAVEAGDIKDVATLLDWLAVMMTSGSGFSDGVFLAHAHRCMERSDIGGLNVIAELSAAYVSSRERQLETTAQGRAFIEIATTAWNAEPLTAILAQINAPVVYPVAVATVSAAHGIELPLVLHAFLHAQAANWISAAARLIPLGQTDSQRAVAGMEAVVGETGARALVAKLDDIGGMTFRADIAAMRHETQYTRLFRS